MTGNWRPTVSVGVQVPGCQVEVDLEGRVLVGEVTEEGKQPGRSAKGTPGTAQEVEHTACKAISVAWSKVCLLTSNNIVEFSGKLKHLSSQVIDQLIPEVAGLVTSLQES